MKNYFSVKVIAALLALVALLGCLCACGKGADEPSVTGTAGGETAAAGDHPQVKVTMENGKSFTIELYPEFAPETVEHFLKLVDSGFYDGVPFHRVVKGFMAQGGDPDGDGNSNPGEETIHGEFAANGFTQNTLSHTRGVVSMARSQDPDSASSQFFICYSDNYTSSLDGSYAAFGKVIEGMETVDEFTEGEFNYNSIGELASPVNPIIMAKAERVAAE